MEKMKVAVYRISITGSLDLSEKNG